MNEKEKERYEIFKIRQGRCHYCGCRLKWEAFEVRGLYGGWVIDENAEGGPQALCYKCFEFPLRGKTAHRLAINEVQRPTGDAVGDPSLGAIDEDLVGEPDSLD